MFSHGRLGLILGIFRTQGLLSQTNALSRETAVPRKNRKNEIKRNKKNKSKREKKERRVREKEENVTLM